MFPLHNFSGWHQPYSPTSPSFRGFWIETVKPFEYVWKTENSNITKWSLDLSNFCFWAFWTKRKPTEDLPPPMKTMNTNHRNGRMPGTKKHLRTLTPRFRLKIRKIHIGFIFVNTFPVLFKLKQESFPACLLPILSSDMVLEFQHYQKAETQKISEIWSSIQKTLHEKRFGNWRSVFLFFCSFAKVLVLNNFVQTSFLLNFQKFQNVSFPWNDSIPIP